MTNNEFRIPWGKLFLGVLSLNMCYSCGKYNSNPISAERLLDSQGIESLVIVNRRGEKEYLQETSKGYYINKDYNKYFKKIEMEK